LRVCGCESEARTFSRVRTSELSETSRGATPQAALKAAVSRSTKPELQKPGTLIKGGTSASAHLAAGGEAAKSQAANRRRLAAASRRNIGVSRKPGITAERLMDNANALYT
jgi:hypothetical protein